jgi:S-adenosylmethionine-diacylglycerol 3-amino-3-carboxypropyl transferase
MNRTFGEHFAIMFARALSSESLASNPYVSQVWRDRYPDRERVPPYLRQGARERILALGAGRLSLQKWRFDEFVAQRPEHPRFDLIQTSNISDWMPIPELRSLLERIEHCLAPGGAIVARRLNGDVDLAAIVAERFTIDASARELESSGFYQDVVAGYKKP